MFVACKIPNGLNCGGVLIVGNANPPGQPQKPLYGGYALTQDVDAEKFNAWLRYSAESAVVQNKMILWADTFDEIIVLARANAGAESGLGPAGSQPVR